MLCRTSAARFIAPNIHIKTLSSIYIHTFAQLHGYATAIKTPTVYYVKYCSPHTCVRTACIIRAGVLCMCVCVRSVHKRSEK